MVKVAEINEEDILTKFPGPIVLPSLVKWWKGVAIGVALIIASAFARYIPGSDIELTLAIFGMAFAGLLCTVFGVFLFLRPGAGLRLDEAGFEVAGPLRKQTFRWSEVSDFGVWSQDKSSFVAFKAAKPRLTNSDKMNAALTGGRNELLPDTYGMTADNLVQLMTTWRSSAINATKYTGV
jgi:hypothetical protein